MDTELKFGRKRIGMPGRYAITIECADDLSLDEISLMEAFFKAEVLTIQKHRHSDRFRGIVAATITVRDPINPFKPDGTSAYVANDGAHTLRLTGTETDA